MVKLFIHWNFSINMTLAEILSINHESFSVYLTYCTCNAAEMKRDRREKGGLCPPQRLKLPHFFPCMSCTGDLLNPPIKFAHHLQDPALYNLHHDLTIGALSVFLCASNSCLIYPFLQFIQRQSLCHARDARRASWRAAAPIDKNPHLRESCIQRHQHMHTLLQASMQSVGPEQTAAQSHYKGKNRDLQRRAFWWKPYLHFVWCKHIGVYFAGDDGHHLQFHIYRWHSLSWLGKTKRSKSLSLPL